MATEPKIISTRKMDHLLVAPAWREVTGPNVGETRGDTACGRTVTGIHGHHVSGEFRVQCGSCRRSSLYREIRETLRRESDDYRGRVLAARLYVTTRFFPPLPAEYGEVAVDAIDACNEGDEDRLIYVGHLNPVPKGTAATGKVRAGSLVNALRLGHMVESEEDDSYPYCAKHGESYDPEHGCPECVAEIALDDDADAYFDRY